MKDSDIIIFLNEPDEKVYVKVPAGFETHFQLQNLAGKVLQEAIHDKPLQDFELNNLPDGNYFVIVNQNDVIRSKKIVKGFHP